MMRIHQKCHTRARDLFVQFNYFTFSKCVGSIVSNPFQKYYSKIKYNKLQPESYQHLKVKTVKRNLNDDQFNYFQKS